MLLDPKNESQSDKSFFIHSIQEWLAKVKETTDKIGGMEKSCRVL